MEQRMPKIKRKDRLIFDYTADESDLIDNLRQELKKQGFELYIVKNVYHKPHYDYLDVVIRKHEANK